MIFQSIRNVLVLFLIAFLQILPQIQPASAQDRGQILLSEDSDYFGFDLLAEKDVTLDQCKASCLDNLGCAAFTYNTSASFCFLKSDFGELKPFAGAIAGRVVKIGSEADIGAPAKLSFLPENIVEEARKFRTEIVTSKNFSEDQGFVTLTKTAGQRLVNGDINSAISNVRAALRIDPKHQPSWLLLSEAANVFRSNNSSQTRQFKRAAISAAINGYLLSRSKSSRAASLARLARGLESQRQYRSALTAYKKSLDLDDVPTERRSFAALRQIHGFRVLDHTIESDNLSPRICVQFSEKLKNASVGYADFISVDRAPPQAIDVSQQQICVEGLQHGKTYNVVLRRGLPSTLDEDLQADVSLNIYIKDRKPAIRFTGNNFVLPATLRRGIPLVSVNANKANLELYRIGARSLAPLLRDSKFLQQLGSYEVEYLVEDLGVAVWSGSVDIKPTLNREVVTSIPIDEALPQRKPGIYFLTAAPSTNGPDDYDVNATQWFVISDIGLTTFSGSEHMRVFTRSLSSAKSIANVEITLIARNNEVLGTSRTDDQGQASFDAGLLRGKDGLAPAIITARNGTQDFVFLDILKPGFDFSDRGVTGRAAPKGVDVYAWSERGIYRAGETVHVAALARDSAARAIKDLPLTFVFYRPDGVEDRRIVDKGEALGGYGVKLPLTQNAKRGTWQMKIFTDPKSDPVAEQRFLVEDFLPEKTDFSLIPVENSIEIGQSTVVDVKGRYLYGAPAANLKLEGEMIIRAKRQRKGYEGYLFGLAAGDEGLGQQIVIGDIAPLNSEGESTFEVVLDKAPATTRMQSAELVVRMREANGRAIERRVEIDVTAQGLMIGVKPQFEGGQIGENSIADFDVVAVDPDGNKAWLSGAKWSLIKIERNYQWYKSGSSWNYESVDIESKVGDGVVDLKSDAASKLSVPVEWGRYRLDVDTGQAKGPATSVEFTAGWYVQSQSTQTPDGLELALDKSAYKAGEVAKLKISPRFAGEMLIAIGTDHIVKTKTVSVPASGAVVDIEVDSNWGAGAYILATLYRPSQDQSSASKSRMPMRAIGVKWLTVEPQQRQLNVSLGVADKIQAHESLVIPVTINDLKAGEEAYVTVAAVDVGILNLTNYQSPDPVSQYFGQRKLAISMRDIYGRLIDGSQGISGRLRTGGDMPDGLTSSGSPPTEELVAFFSGPVRVDDNGQAKIEFDLPQFNGTVRIMATAWTGEGVGAAQKETIIRDPVVISTSLPRFMAPGDEARMLVEIANTDASSGAFDVAYVFSENLKPGDDQLSERIELASGEKTNLDIPVTAGLAGNSWARIEISRPDGFFVMHEANMKIRSGILPVTRKLKVPLVADSGSVKVDKDLLAGNLLEGAKVNISVALANSIDVPSLLLQLDRYPYGCAEQITSKALPLLYVSDFPANFSGDNDDKLKEKIQKAINTVLSYQSSSGGFSLWGRQSDELWLSAYVTDFLTRAIEKGYQVPRQSVKLSLQNLQNVLAYENNLDENDEAIAYTLYVLARNRLASAGDLRYYVDTQLNSFQSPIARAQLAAAMALYGDQQRAERTFASAYQLAKNSARSQSVGYSYGSSLRDAAAMLALASESRPEPSNTQAMKNLVASLNKADRYTSTQEQAWMLLAARATSKSNELLSLEINGLPHNGAFYRQMEGSELVDQPLQVSNRNAQDLEAVITTVAVPDESPPAGGDGFTIERIYFRMDGTLTNIAQVKQNERFVVVINVKQLNDHASRLIISDLLPAGFEIDNPKLVKSADLSNFKWLPNTEAAHSEFLNDRFVIAFNRAKGGQNDFTVAYTVRAVTPGTFMHPAATVEDMYRPQLSARTVTGWMRVELPQ